jgi:hypothetical protein
MTGPLEGGPPAPGEPTKSAESAQPPMNRWFSSEHAIGLAASILIGVVTLTRWLTAWSDWNSYQVLEAYEDSPVRDAGAVDQSNLISGSLGIVAALALLASATVFIVWLGRVRWNSEMFCRGAHRLTRGWVVGSWICPVVNLWYPKWVVDDVLAASDPRTPPHIPSLRGIPGTRLVWAWWLTWVVGLVFGNVAERSVLDGAPEVSELFADAVMSGVSAVSTSAAAVLAVLVIRRVNDLQTQRPWIPWWSHGAELPRDGRPPGPPGSGYL